MHRLLDMGSAESVQAFHEGLGEGRGQVQRKKEGQERKCEGDSGGKITAIGQQSDEHGSDEGRDEDLREDDIVHGQRTAGRNM